MGRIFWSNMSSPETEAQRVCVPNIIIAVRSLSRKNESGQNSWWGMAGVEVEAGSEEVQDYVYRISTAKEWEELQKNGSAYGGDLDKSSGFIHLSKLDQVQSTLQNFFKSTNLDLYLLQIDAKKEQYGNQHYIAVLGTINGGRVHSNLGEGLIYEVVDGKNSFPHFYGPSRSFIPLPLDAVTKVDKISLIDGQFSCSLLN